MFGFAYDFPLFIFIYLITIMEATEDIIGGKVRLYFKCPGAAPDLKAYLHYKNSPDNIFCEPKNFHWWCAACGG